MIPSAVLMAGSTKTLFVLDVPVLALPVTSQDASPAKATTPLVVLKDSSTTDHPAKPVLLTVLLAQVKTNVLLVQTLQNLLLCVVQITKTTTIKTVCVLVTKNVRFSQIANVNSITSSTSVIVSDPSNQKHSKLMAYLK